MMTVKIQQIITALLLSAAMPLNAQVLWSDDFESYPTGALSNDPTGQTPGQGGWYVKENNSELRVISESGRGNVLAWGWTTGDVNHQFNRIDQIGLTALWNT